MKKTRTGQSTRMALPSATSTWRTAAKHERVPVQISPVHLEKEQQLENALDEYCLLREQDRSLTASRFCDRYPSYRHSLRRLIDVHDAMAGQPALDDEQWPELFAEFLGFEILHELGVGAIARVYLAAEAALGGRLVAIKVAREGGYEAETLGKLTHPNVVPVFSVKHDEQTDLTAVCMPYHGSATLADLLEIGFQDGKPPTTAKTILDAAREREQIVDFVESVSESRPIDSVLSAGNYVDGVVRLAIQMADALAYTHERGILHRDLKPSNVLLTPDGVPMLLDFNLASGIEAGAQRLGGTLPYMPPEQIRDVHLQPFAAEMEGDPRSDIFSLGVILYELLTGKLPFGDPPACVAPRQAAEEFLAAQQKGPRSVRDLNPAVSSELAQVLHQCLALEPSQRPSSAAELVSELEKYFSPRRRVKRWTASHPGLATTLLLLVLSIASAGIWHLATRPEYAVRQYKAGVADLKRGRQRDAIEHFDHAIKLHENCVACRFARGIAYQRLGDHKQAEIDLSHAAEAADDPLIFESRGYSLMHLWTAADVKIVGEARSMYGELREVSAEQALSRAYANYVAQANASVVVANCDVALKKRPAWHDAYHLRALGYLIAARQELQKDIVDRDQEKLTTSIQNAQADFEQAILRGPPSALLFTDTATAYAIRDDGNEPTERVKELLQLAAVHGMPRLNLLTLGERHAWDQEPWFKDILSSCSNGSGTLSEPNHDERFLTPPDSNLINERLSSYQIESFHTSR